MNSQRDETPGSPTGNESPGSPTGNETPPNLTDNETPPDPTSNETPQDPTSNETPQGPTGGEEYNPGPVTPPRQAATVILLRGETVALEVLLVKRTPHARFMGGVWVFPGGAVDREEGRGDDAHRAAAVRELREEAAIELAATDLVPYSRWITPAEVRVRFDTHFFLAPLPAGQEPRVDGEECVDLGWFTPAGALQAHAREEIALVFPTIRHLEELSEFATAADLLRHASGLQVRAVQPRILLGEEGPRVVMPGEPGYE